MTDVAIVGIGIHPFGRHDATGRQQGAHAARLAMADAGVEWKDIEYAFGGSAAAGNADTMVADLGLTGVPFINVANGCATGGSALISSFNAIRAGAADLTMVIGFDKHPRGAFDPVPADWGLGKWYGDSGLMLTTQFFGMKINRYMHDHGITNSTLAKVGVKAFHNASLNENAWRRVPMSEDQVANAAMLSYPLTQYMFCSPGEGGVALVLARADKAHQYTDKPVYLKAASLKSRRFGSFEVFSQCRTRKQARKSCIWQRPDCVQTASRSGSSRTARPRSMVVCRSTPMAAVLATANRSGRQGFVKCTKACCSFEAMPVCVRSQTTPRRPSPMCMALREFRPAPCCPDSRPIDS
jgi:acetyl-CoA C-acetyltransferase